MKLIIVRHGATDYNLHRRIQGQIDTELNELGLEQAEELGAALAGESLQLVLSSDLTRARQTTAAVLRHQSAVPVEYTARLRERHFGCFQDRPSSELKRALEVWPGERETYRPDGGESLLESHERVRALWQEILRKHAEKTLLVSAHGGVCKSLVALVLGEDLRFRNDLAQDNCCINVLNGSAGSGFVAEKINSVDHLAHPTGMEGL